MIRQPLMTPVNFTWDLPRFGRNGAIASIGSCFSQNFAETLAGAGFRVASNPNGILYNPVSVADALERIASKTDYLAEEFFEFNGKWRSWFHHGSFADSDQETAVRKCNESSAAFGEVARNCGLFIVTLSSAVVYRLIDSGRVAANCHKVPGTRFRREILSVEECIAQTKRIVGMIRNINPSCVILLTLSPVRHYPGDLVLNARSKAHLLTAIHLCCDLSDNVRYFPAYEIAQDELRDYRFYKEDMLHPTPLAVDLILDRFVSQVFDDDSQALFKEARRRLLVSLHRQNATDSEE